MTWSRFRKDSFWNPLSVVLQYGTQLVAATTAGSFDTLVYGRTLSFVCWICGLVWVSSYVISKMGFQMMEWDHELRPLILRNLRYKRLSPTFMSWLLRYYFQYMAKDWHAVPGSLYLAFWIFLYVSHNLGWVTCNVTDKNVTSFQKKNSFELFIVVNTQVLSIFV